MKIQLNGQFLDIEDNEEINYVMQVQDLADVSTVNSSFTTSFRLPKTVTNYEALNSLSLNSDTSKMPYLKQVCKLYNYDTTIIDNGWLKINSTDVNFNINIENGIIDLFKAVEGKSIGRDLNLDSVNHNKDVPTVLNSFTRDDYCYIVADYNGMNTYREADSFYINTDYLVPSLNNRFIWDKIFTTFGFTYEGSVFDSEEFKNLWITYPKSPPLKTDDEEYPQPILRALAEANNPDYSNWLGYEGYIKLAMPSNVTLNEMLVDGSALVAQSDGTFNVKSISDAFTMYQEQDNWGYPIRDTEYSLRLEMFINGSIVAGFNPNFNFILKAGDRIEFGFDSDPLRGDGYMSALYTEVRSFKIEVFQISQAVIDFSKEFLDFSISEFLKENFIRFALTPFIDVEKKHIKFLTLSERLNSEKIIDWSDKYIERTNESYTYGSYSQKNIYKHKYNDENADFNNGFISVSNKNLEESKDLYTSKIYSFNSEITSFYIGRIKGNVYPIWSREIKETINNDDNTRVLEVSYKGLSNRYYFMRRKALNERFINFGSQLMKVSGVSNNVVVSDVSNLTYSEIIPKKYGEFSKVLNDTRIHTIDLNLDINDLLSIKFDEIYYFEQENQYYLLNRLNLSVNNKKSTGEFLRVKYR